MTRKEVKTKILLEFLSEFNETTPICLTNDENFYLCTSPLTTSTKPSDSPWVRFMVENNTTAQKTMGNKGSRRWRRTGFISAQVFIPSNSGTKDGDVLCEEIVSIFEGENLDGIWFDQGMYEEIGNTDTMLFQYNIIIYYSFDETK